MRDDDSGPGGPVGKSRRRRRHRGFETSGVRWVMAAVLGILLATAGCSAGESGATADTSTQRIDARTCSTAVQYWYDAEAGRCVEISCGGGADVETTYFSRAACRQAHGVRDVGPTDATLPEDTETADGTKDADTAVDEDTNHDDVGDGGGTDGGGDTGGDVAPDAGGTCADQGRTACFSNYDCASDERCENTRSSGNPLPCCVKGERGTKTAGDPCTDTGQTSCKSGVCISKSSSDTYYCSKRCDSDADCTENVESCTTVFGSSDKWCFPTG